MFFNLRLWGFKEWTHRSSLNNMTSFGGILLTLCKHIIDFGISLYFLWKFVLKISYARCLSTSLLHWLQSWSLTELCANSVNFNQYFFWWPQFSQLLSQIYLVSFRPLSLCKELLYCNNALGVIQQLRGQEEGEGGSAKSPHLSTQGRGSFECPRGPKSPIAEIILYHCSL